MIDNLECPVCPGLAEECKGLMRSWRLKAWHSDFDIEMCHIVVKFKDCIEDFRWKPEPSQPEDYGKYLALSFKDRMAFLEKHPLFLTQGKVANYLNNRDMIRNLNRRNHSTLVLWRKAGISVEAREVVDRYFKTYVGRILS